MRGMDMEQVEIIYEDNHLLVVKKPQNMPVQEDRSGDPDLLSYLKADLKTRHEKPGNVYLGLVHRLDRPTGGVMVFAKTSKAAARLSEDIREGEMEKTYLAVVVGKPKEDKATLVHYLKKNPVTNNVYLCAAATEGAKRAELSYEVLETQGPVSLVKVRLKTGRGHQIRVQMQAIGCPVFGDARYGGELAKGYRMALWATDLRFPHPTTGDTMVFICYPPEEEEPWKRFDLSRHLAIVKAS